MHGYFRRVVLGAFVVGMLAGGWMHFLQSRSLQPLLRQAESLAGLNTHPHHAAGHSGSHAAAHGSWSQGHGHHHPQVGHHSHGSAGHGPSSGSSLLIVNVVTATGFALLLMALMGLRGEVPWWQGAAWGLAGWCCVFGAPSLGLEPSLPGVAAALLAERQQWWLLTAVATGAGLWLLCLGRGPLRWLGLPVLAFPHLLGAPPPPSAPPDALLEVRESFLQAVRWVNLLYWLALGILSALAVQFCRRGGQEI